MNASVRPSLFLPLFAALSCAALLPAQESDAPFHVWQEEVPGKGYRFFFRSPDAIPRSVELKFSTLQNLEPSKAVPLRFVTKEATEKKAFLDLKVIDPKKGHRFRFQSAYHIGDFRDAKHDDTAVYLFPFEHGTKRRIYQGYRGVASHADEGREFAIDFKMPEGTKIYAAREGIVIGAKEDSDRGGWSKSFDKYSNHVHILHGDGSIAKYEHLQKGGVSVAVGETVKAGQQIALSGNTGWTSGPHLHFEVVIPTETGEGKSLPTKFLNHLRKAVPPEAGEIYYALHPGKPAFEAVFPEPPTNADYADHRAEVPKNNKVTSREEMIDTTTVLFIRNGFPVAKQIKIEMPQLRNLKASKEFPLTMVVEPMTERFLVLMRPEELALPTRYRASWNWEDAK